MQGILQYSRGWPRETGPCRVFYSIVGAGLERQAHAGSSIVGAGLERQAHAGSSIVGAGLERQAHAGYSKVWSGLKKGRPVQGILWWGLA
jgi:hypothetical protein